MEDILLIHRSTAKKLETSFPVWRTCLRQIAFIPQKDIGAARHVIDQNDELLEGVDALTFLVEVLCGLHSPVLGETEVLGQFRQFLDSTKVSPLFIDANGWLRFLFQEVKEIRARHVLAMGPNSYGSLLRKRLRDVGSISICGTGQLTKELLPWLADGRAIQIFTRNPKIQKGFSSEFQNLSFSSYSDSVRGSALLIAAPLSDEQIFQLAKSAIQKDVIVFDLRGEKNEIYKHLPGAVTLQDLFVTLDALKVEQGARSVKAKNEIRRRVEEYLSKVKEGR